MTSSNEQLFDAAQRVIPGGVNSPVRAFRAVGGAPRFIARGEGARVWDVDGNEYIDYVGSWGPLVLGHAHPAVVAAVCDAAARGLSYGAPTAAEVELAELLCRRVPALEQVRLVSSGTEATMSAIRLAREQGALPEAFLVTYGDSFLPIDFAEVWRAFLASGQPALMTVYRNHGQWDASNVV